MAQPHRPLTSRTAGADQEEMYERTRWVINLRWTLAVALLMVGFFGNAFHGDTPGVRGVHVGLALFVFAYNLFYYWIVKQFGSGREQVERTVRYGQVILDLVVITSLLHYSGGITSPVFVLYFLYVFVALAIMPPSGAYWVAIGAAIFYGALATAEFLGMTPPAGTLSMSQGAEHITSVMSIAYVATIAATLIITAYIANYFAGLLTKDESTIRKQLDEMNTLYSVSKQMSDSLTSEEVMRTLVSLGIEIGKADACSLLLFNEQGEGVFAASAGFTTLEQNISERHVVNPKSEVVIEILSKKRGVYAENVDTYPGLRTLLVRNDTRSFYAIPMINDGRLMGTLNLSYTKQYKLPQSQWDLFEAIAQQAAFAVERTRLFTDAERAAREMTGLYHIGLATTSSLQIEEVLRLLYEQVNRVFHPDTFYIGLYDEDAGELRFDIFVENGDFLPPFRTRLAGGVSAYVIRNRRPVFVRNWDAEIEQLPFEAGVVGAPTQAVLSVPLMAKNKMVGVMSVQSLRADAFDQDHLRLLTSIAGQSALALENAKLHAQVFEQAQRDPLTGVYNHGTFIDRLLKGVREGASGKQAVALIMLDIDRFKQYNDTYGHMVGDDVLRSIVVAIQNHLKGTDVVGRWGGEEFGIILPGVSRAQARLVAERIRQTAAHATLKDIHNRTIPSPTVSQGLAMYPDDATNIEELIDKADSALYRAKDLGRNQITEWIEMDGDRPIAIRARG